MNKTVFITGTSRGIGFSLAKIFLANNYHVIGTSRTGIVEQILNSSFEVLKLDLANFESFKVIDKILSERQIKIDILINNAGIGPDLDLALPETTTFKETIDVNVTGTTFFTETIIKHINDSGKIVNISSKMGSIEQCKLSDSVAYRMSKTALNMYTKILTNRLSGQQFVSSVHPGWVKTTISKNNVNGRLSADESALRIYEFITSDFKTGIFWNVETQTECEW